MLSLAQICTVFGLALGAVAVGWRKALCAIGITVFVAFFYWLWTY